MDSNENVYVADYNNHVVRVIYATGTVPYIPSKYFPFTPGNIYTIAGNGTAGFIPSDDDGPAIGVDSAHTPELDHPFGLMMDSSGDLYISNQGSCIVSEVLASTQYIYTVAGKAERALRSTMECQRARNWAQLMGRSTAAAIFILRSLTGYWR